ncbi:hypothetical protein [Veillonella sp.]|uniref:hypothetical protein n=1 Tax=Veillonella sp. TaxID=1926307 RepID=UPI0025EF82FE|nr:hypothetical protein [Veillonella sp.]
MKKIASLILLIITIISIAIYQYYYHDGSPNNIVIMDESHELVDTSINESISKRILAVYLEDPYYYYLGYDGIGRYDIKNHVLDVLEFEISGDELEEYKIYHPQSKMIVNKKTKLGDFSDEDLDNFEKMLMNSDRGAKYYNKRWYHSGYEATLLDLDKHLIITNDVRGIEDTSTKILIFNMSGFIIIDKEINNIQVYFDESIAGKKDRDSLVAMLRYNYGDHLTILNSIDEIGEAERTILLQLRNNYVSKK